MRTGDCIHFTGIQHERCAAGVRYLDVRDDSGKGPYRWPCLPNVRWGGRPPTPCATTCASFRAMTEEEDRAEQAKWSEAFARYVDGKCPQCGAELIQHENEQTRVSVCPTHGFVGRACKIVEPGDEP